MLVCVMIRDVDEVVLSYMIGILEELGDSTASEEVFDVEQFTEMMDAYLPGFHSFDSVTVSEWMFELASDLTTLQFSDGLLVGSTDVILWDTASVLDKGCGKKSRQKPFNCQISVCVTNFPFLLIPLPG